MFVVKALSVPPLAGLGHRQPNGFNGVFVVCLMLNKNRSEILVHVTTSAGSGLYPSSADTLCAKEN